jgi:hypothetical protein
MVEMDGGAGVRRPREGRRKSEIRDASSRLPVGHEKARNASREGREGREGASGVQLC